MNIQAYRTIIRIVLLASVLGIQSAPSVAQTLRPNIKQGMSYIDARKSLLKQGW